MGQVLEAMRASFSFSVRGRAAPAWLIGSGLACTAPATVVAEAANRPAVRPAPLRRPRLSGLLLECAITPLKPSRLAERLASRLNPVSRHLNHTFDADRRRPQQLACK